MRYNDEPGVQSEPTRHIRERLMTGASHYLIPHHIPVFMTTEIVFDEHQHPFIVSVNSHAPRHWDAIAQEAERGTTALTNMQNIAEAVQSRVDGDRTIRIISNDTELSQYAHLERGLRAAGISAQRCSIKEIASTPETRQKHVALHLPLLLGTKGNRKAALDRTTFVIEPFAYLSSQFLFSMLTDPHYQKAVEEHILQGGGSFESLRAYLPKTIALSDAKRQHLPGSYLIKRALPLSSQRTLGTYGSLNPYELNRHRETSIAQEAIAPSNVYVPQYGTGPFRCITVSYGGEILAMLGIIRLPANGSPARDVSIKITAG